MFRSLGKQRDARRRSSEGIKDIFFSAVDNRFSGEKLRLQRRSISETRKCLGSDPVARVDMTI